LIESLNIGTFVLVMLFLCKSPWL